VLSVAFRAAAQRGVPVTAVHAWSPDVGADHEAVYGPSAASKEGARLVLDEALEVWRSRFPDVPVETRLLAVDPAAALIRESEGAALTVVGSWSRGTVRTALFGSVSRDVAQQARCPVMVARPKGYKDVERLHVMPYEHERLPHPEPHRYSYSDNRVLMRPADWPIS